MKNERNIQRSTFNAQLPRRLAGAIFSTLDVERWLLNVSHFQL